MKSMSPYQARTLYANHYKGPVIPLVSGRLLIPAQCLLYSLHGHYQMYYTQCFYSIFQEFRVSFLIPYQLLKTSEDLMIIALFGDLLTLFFFFKKKLSIIIIKRTFQSEFESIACKVE